ncbi:protein-L-isoaspartate O-methyltransferase family protein [Streptomyces bacillaris]|uniref:protein-L-isoaspartate O-methyltransferase family protein n=1 Tax=Streptomyces bacillaris TaxID=68179 RepID=UPI00380B6960
MITGDDLLHEAQDRLDAVMQSRGLWPEEDSSWIRGAVAAVPRHRFAPAVVWEWDGWTWVAVDREAEPGRWAALVYPAPEDSTVTQVTDGLATSSLSCTQVVADMLDSLMVEPGQSVVELGTGSGWNAALLAHRAGPQGRVVSVETDAGLAQAAAGRLAAAGARVEVWSGDGTAGIAGLGPVDRLVATYAVETVPGAWIEQVRPGGRIVIPWGRLGHFALTVAEDGKSATGWLQGLATFMGDRRATSAAASPALAPGGEAAVDDQEMFEDLTRGHLLFALRVSHPGIVVSVEDRGAGACVRLREEVSGRSAVVERADHGLVEVSGEGQELWAALRTGYQLWRERGRPEQWDFGMTVSPAGQTVWIHDSGSGPYAG